MAHSIKKTTAVFETNPRQTGVSSVWYFVRQERVIILLLLLGFALRLHFLNSESIWLDEGTSLHLANSSIGNILADRAADKNPPFYFLLLRGWVNLVGDSVFATRLLSGMFSTLSLVLFYKVGQELFNKRTALLASFILAFSSFHITYAQEIRGYALMVLLTLLSMFVFLRLLTKPSRLRLVAYVLINTLLIYTHFYGFLFLAVLNLFYLTVLLLHRQEIGLKLHHWVLAQMGIFVLFLPWLQFVLNELNEIQSEGLWIPRPSLVDLWATLVTYASDSLGLLLLFGVILFYGLVGRHDTAVAPQSATLTKHFGQSTWQGKYLCLLWFGLPLLLPFFISQVTTPIYYTRYTIVASLGFYLLAAQGLTRLRQPFVLGVALLLITGLQLVSLSHFYTGVNKQQWREMLAYIEENGGQEDILLYNMGGNIITYYLQRNDLSLQKLPLQPTPMSGTAYQNLSQETLASLIGDHDHVWLALSRIYNGEEIVAERLSQLVPPVEQLNYNRITLYAFESEPQIAAADDTAQLDRQPIHYALPEAGAATLVWGVDGWQALPPEQQPPGTVIKDGLIYTPMEPTQDGFSTVIKVPAGHKIDFVFQVNTARSGAPLELWDTNGGQDFVLPAATKDTAVIQPTLAAAEIIRLNTTTLTTQEIRYGLRGATAVNLVWGVNGWQALPPAYWPTDTQMVGGLLYTPMSPDGSDFVVPVSVAESGQLDYVFQTFVDNGSGVVEVWDTNQGADFQVLAEKSEVVKVRPSISIWPYQLQALASGWGWPLWLGIGLLVLSSGYVISRQKPRWQGMGNFFSSRRWLYLRDLMVELISRDIKLRYKGAFLGILWSLLNPFTQLLVFSFVFQALLPLDIPDYPAYLFTGLLAWGWFNSSLTSSATVILEGRDLIRRPGFPPIVLPVVTVGSNLIHFLLALPILLLFLLFTNIVLQATIFWLPLIIVLQFIFTLSLAYFVATFHVLFRDTQHVINMILLLLFYLTPIFYDAGRFSEKIQWLFRLNPLLVLLDAYRAVLINGQSPDFVGLLLLLAGSLALLGVGYQLFLRTSYRFVEEL